MTWKLFSEEKLSQAWQKNQQRIGKKSFDSNISYAVGYKINYISKFFIKMFIKRKTRGGKSYV